MTPINQMRVADCSPMSHDCHRRDDGRNDPIQIHFIPENVQSSQYCGRISVNSRLHGVRESTSA